MENASKALLIAAAVLVVILIIAFGMQIMNSSTGTTDQVDSTMNTSEAQAFNSQFTAYRGKQKGTAIRNLLIAIKQSNLAHAAHPVTEPSLTLDSVDDTKIYDVSFTYGADGYITAVTISE